MASAKTGSRRAAGRERVELVNRQHEHAVPVAWLRRAAARAIDRLKIRVAGRFTIAMVDEPTMRALNRRFLRHRGLTDVLSFRYDDEPVVGEILVSPAFARRYADEHRVSYRQELARYVIHGLLHWAGHEDDTSPQQRRMRALEDALLDDCAKRSGRRAAAVS